MGVLRVGQGRWADVRVSPASFEAAWDEPPGSPRVTHDSRVSELMRPASRLLTVPPETSCADADALARERRVRHLLVTVEERLLGVLCRCDLCPPLPGERVVERMSHEIYAVPPDATLGEATAALADVHVGCLPVVEGERVVGVITRGDLRRAGVPEALLGASTCALCGSPHGVRPGTHSGIEVCLDCIDVTDAFHDLNDFGEGD